MFGRQMPKISTTVNERASRWSLFGLWHGQPFRSGWPVQSASAMPVGQAAPTRAIYPRP